MPSPSSAGVVGRLERAGDRIAAGRGNGEALLLQALWLVEGAWFPFSVGVCIDGPSAWCWENRTGGCVLS